MGSALGVCCVSREDKALEPADLRPTWSEQRSCASSSKSLPLPYTLEDWQARLASLEADARTTGTGKGATTAADGDDVSTTNRGRALVDIIAEFSPPSWRSIAMAQFIPASPKPGAECSPCERVESVAAESFDVFERDTSDSDHATQLDDASLGWDAVETASADEAPAAAATQHAMDDRVDIWGQPRQKCFAGTVADVGNGQLLLGGSIFKPGWYLELLERQHRLSAASGPQAHSAATGVS